MIPLGDQVFFGAYFEQFNSHIPVVNKGVAEMGPFKIILISAVLYCSLCTKLDANIN